MNYKEQLNEVKYNLNLLVDYYKKFHSNVSKEWNSKEMFSLKDKMKSILNVIKDIYEKNKKENYLFERLDNNLESCINNLNSFINNFEEIISETDLLKKKLNKKSPSQLLLNNKCLYSEKIEPLIEEIKKYEFN